MSKLHEIDGIVFGGEKYTVGGTGEVPEGLIDPMDIEWVGDGGSSGGELRSISPTGIPVKLPDIDLRGNYITTISSYNFRNMARVLSGVILPSHLVEVPSSLFDGGQLELVEFGVHLISIGNYTFRNNQLTSVDLPDSLTSIGYSAFENNQLTSVDLPDSLTSIGSNVFNNNQLTSIRIPDNINTYNWFDGNPLESIHTGGITNISDSFHVFSRTPTLKHITFGEAFVDSQYNNVFGSAIESMTIEGELTFSDKYGGTEGLSNGTFGVLIGNRSLIKTITLSSLVDEVPSGLFDNFEQLSDVYLAPNTVYYEDSFVSDVELTIHGGILDESPIPDEPEPDPEPGG